ncbi:hypothetical protein [Tenacibaculum ovolyticum]|uniref:hypothetical protein n=1 Tax=Tenacibaculum ovolyticum TaxID=104270 RepID=UPI0007EC8E79|nr:hypothetical protein [Tenacibaculum ovolyticum]
MKKEIIVLIVLLFLKLSVYSQFGGVTKDPFNLAVNTAIKKINLKTLSETIQSKKRLMEMINIYNDWNDNVKIVSGIIKSSQTVNSIKNSSLKLGHKYNQYVNEINNVQIINYNEKQAVIEYYTIILDDGINELSEFNKIIGDGFKMNDYERLNLLKRIRDKLEYQNGLLDYFNKKVKYKIKEKSIKEKNSDFFEIKL